MTPAAEETTQLAEDIERLSITENGATHIRWIHQEEAEVAPQISTSDSDTKRKVDGLGKKKINASYVPPHRRRKTHTDKDKLHISTATAPATDTVIDKGKGKGKGKNNANAPSTQPVGSHLNALANTFTPHRYNTRAAAATRRAPEPPRHRTETTKAINKGTHQPKARALQRGDSQQTNLPPFERALLSISPNSNVVTEARTARHSKRQGKRLHIMDRPIPSAYYLNSASDQPQTLTAPRKLLVILDLNGTLLFRKKFHGNNNFIARPQLGAFLDYLFQNHRTMVWSSAQPQNVAAMCSQLFTDVERESLAGIWARDTLRIPPQYYNEKVQVYKQLSWLWNETKIQASSQGDDMWTQNNTVLIDDSVEKAASEPHNIIEIEEFEARPDQMQADVLGQVKTYLQQLSWQANVSAYIRAQPFQYDATLGSMGTEGGDVGARKFD